MATWELLENTGSKTDGTDFITSGAVEPSGGWQDDDRIVLVVAASNFSPVPGLPTFSGAGTVPGDWDTDAEQAYHSTAQRHPVIASADASGFSGTQAFTATWGANVANAYMYVLCGHGVDNTDALEVTQVETSETTGTAAPTAGTFPTTAPTAGNLNLCIVNLNQNTTEPTGDFTTQPTWQTDAAPVGSLTIMYGVADTDPDFDWSPTSSKYSVLYVEYNAAPTATYVDGEIVLTGVGDLASTGEVVVEGDVALTGVGVQTASGAIDFIRGRHYDINLGSGVTINSGPE